MRNMHCATCNHHKPTLNTMGMRAHDFYPLAKEKMACEGQQNCPECHAIIHVSHSECMGCRHRRETERAANTHQATVLTTASGSKDAMRSQAVHAALKAPDPKLALTAGAPRPKTAVEALCDKYRGMDPLAILDDLELIQGGEESCLDKMDEKKRIAKEEAKAKEREKEREREKAQAAEQAKTDLELAKQVAEETNAERKRKREGAQDRIAAMLAEDEAQEQNAGSPAAEAEVEEANAETEQAQKLDKKAELLKQAEELRLKQEELKKKREAEEEERRKKMRERRLQRNGETEEEERRKKMRERRLQRNAAATGAPVDSTVVLDE